MPFVPLHHDADDMENRTGLWLCPRLERPAASEPFVGTRLYATREAVTGGVALRIEIPKGSRGIVTYEHSPLPAGSAGITFYARASEPLDLTLKNVLVRVGTTWAKHDVPWAALGTKPDAPDIGYEFTLGLAAPAPRDVWIIIDRLGTEGPTFEAAPPLSPTRGPDRVINTRELVGNAAVLAPTMQRLRRRERFRIVAFGDSVTAGAQSFRGNWDLKDAAPQHLYFSRLARGLEKHFGVGNIACVQNGHGGWTAEKAKTVAPKVFGEMLPGDVLLLEFGANDLGWAEHGIDRWLTNLRDLVHMARAKTDQIVVLTPTVGGKIPQFAPAISAAIRRFAQSERVAYADITLWSLYRGEAFAWAYLANEYHPDFMGHAMIGEIVLPLFTGEHFDWPPRRALTPASRTRPPLSQVWERGGTRRRREG